jgi:formylglycine-generating enzyme required for sulfatase activity
VSNLKRAILAILLISAAGAVGCKTSNASPAPQASSRQANPPPGDCGQHANGSKYCDGSKVLECVNGTENLVQSCGEIETCEASSLSCVGKCQAGEVYIPKTPEEGFMMGKGRQKDRDKPHQVVLTKAFCMDEAEVTAGAYKECVDKGKCEEPWRNDTWASYGRYPDHPVNLVSWTKAKAYCESLGKSLPTEAQWEWAATGGDGREWAWGDEVPTCANELMDFTPGGAPKSSPGGDHGCHGGGPSDVKSHPKGVKEWPGGKLYDISGNVWEWTLDLYSKHPSEKQVDPVVTKVDGNPELINHVIRGGGWNRSAIGCSTWFRGAAVRTYQVPGLGFRCVRNR